MAFRTTFAVLSGPQAALSLFDGMFNDLAAEIYIPCTATGTNAIALTPFAFAPLLSAYSELCGFSFKAAATSSSAVTAQFGALAVLPVYLADGATQASTNNVLSGRIYKLIYSLSLNAGGGGFFLETAALPVSGGNFIATIKKQPFTSNGTYTPSTGMLYALFETTAAGGGGGGSTNSPTGVSQGGGGGGGGYSRILVTAALVGGSQTVTVAVPAGAGGGGTTGSNGGDTSIGALCVAKGGRGGAGAVNNSGAAGGAGGVAGTGDWAAPGMPGFSGSGSASASFSPSGAAGGAAGFGTGFGGAGVSSGAGGTGNAGGNYGGGGSGGSSYAGGSQGGGGGAGGFAFITEFCSQ